MWPAPSPAVHRVPRTEPTCLSISRRPIKAEDLSRPFFTCKNMNQVAAYTCALSQESVQHPLSITHHWGAVIHRPPGRSWSSLHASGRSRFGARRTAPPSAWHSSQLLCGGGEWGQLEVHAGQACGAVARELGSQRCRWRACFASPKCTTCWSRQHVLPLQNATCCWG
jgi:hypothetical protein